MEQPPPSASRRLITQGNKVCFVPKGTYSRSHPFAPLRTFGRALLAMTMAFVRLATPSLRGPVVWAEATFVALQSALPNPPSAMPITLICAITVLATSVSAATFGDQNAYTSSLTIRDIVAVVPASPSQSGVCDSITAYLKFNLDSAKARCALYAVSGNDTVLVANAVSEERRFAANAAYAWLGFAFTDPKPIVVGGASYLIALFGDTAGTGSGGLPRSAVTTGTGPVISKNTNYESGFPATLNPSTATVNLKMSAYVTYTPVSPVVPRRRHITSRSYPAP